ncbi:MAG: proton-conducting transporter membrane subunit [Anaerolineales bacterium]
MGNILPLIVIALPWLGAAIIWLAGDKQTRLLHILAVVFSVATGLAALAMIPLASSSATVRIPLGGVLGDFTLVPDGLGILIAGIAAVVGSLAVIFATDYMRHHPEQLSRFYALILFFIGAMIGLGLSGNLLFTFFFWEITALCSYALISFHNDDPRAVAGGVKALIMTQLGGVGLLAGALLLYAYQGNYQINDFLAKAATFPAGVLGVMAFGCLIAAAAKSAQVPFHSWLPDAMEAPTPVTALIHAATMVNAGVYLLARFYPAFKSVPGWSLTVMIVGAASALLAGLMAVAADDIKRVLAYSTISQLGFMVYAVGSGAIFASQFHLLSHAIFKALLFLSAGALITALDTRDLRQMGGLGRKMPFVRAVFVIGAFGLVGLPIANGFFSKDLVLEGGLAGGPFWLYLVMLFSVGVTALYSLRLYRLIFTGERRGPEPVHDGLPAMRVSLALLALATLTSWMLAGPLGRMFSATLPAHGLTAEGTWELVGRILLNPATWIALAVIALGFSLWALRKYLVRAANALKPLAESGFGFEWINRQVAALTESVAAFLQRFQTGQLNWNVAGILCGIIVVLFILMGGK